MPVEGASAKRIYGAYAEYKLRASAERIITKPAHNDIVVVVDIVVGEEESEKKEGLLFIVNVISLALRDILRPLAYR